MIYTFWIVKIILVAVILSCGFISYKDCNKRYPTDPVMIKVANVCMGMLLGLAVDMLLVGIGFIILLPFHA